MFKTSIALAALALAGTALAANIVDQNATISLNGAINLDTGVVLASAGGDLSFTGSSITFQGKAAGFANASGQVGYNNITLQVMRSFLPSNFINTPVTGNALAVNEVIVVKTNGGNYTKCLITAVSGNLLSITFTTYDVTSGPAPAISAVLNNSSLIPKGFPNSGFSGSALIVIQGNNMATPGSVAVLQDSTNGLPATLNGASGFITAGGKNYTLVFYYAIPTQLAAVVPAGVPQGPATLTITFNGQSGVTNVTIVPTAFGIDVYNGNYAVVQDSLTGALITPINSGKQKQLVTVWGDDLGPNPLDSDTTYTGTPHAIPVTIHVYLGGVEQTDVRYAGASTYPGVHIVVFSIAPGTPNGCFIPLIIVTGSGTPVTSNTPVVSVNDNNDVCNDPVNGLDGNQINTFTRQASVQTGSLMLGEITTLGQGGAQANGLAMAPAAAPTGSTTNDFVSASFEKASFLGSASLAFRLNIGCGVVDSVTGSSTLSFGLDPGPLTVTGLAGGPLTLTAPASLSGLFLRTLPQGTIPFATGGPVTFSAPGGTGSNAIAGFNAQVNVTATQFAWTNPPANFPRSNGLTYNWSDAPPGTIVIFGVTSSGRTATCIARGEARQGWIPDYVLNTLNAGTATVFIANISDQNSPIPTDRFHFDYDYSAQISQFAQGAVVQ